MKYYGRVGYIDTVETRPGIWEEQPIERKYRGDIIRLSSALSGMDNSNNENIAIHNQISIVADPFAYKHFSKIRYIEYMDTFWEITSIQVNRPRLIITIGGVYNGNTVGTS